MEMFSTFLCVSGVCIAGGVLRKFSEKPIDPDKQKLNDFFETTNFCNKKENPEFAKVSWIKDYNNFKLFGVNIPIGCDINVLLRMKYALENLFKNDVEILYNNQDYRIKVYKSKLKKAEDYPFEIIKAPDIKHLYITPGVSLDGPMTLNLSETVPNILVAATSGAGKSTLVKGILCQLIENYTSKELNLIYMDNKGGLESNFFKNVEHLTYRTKNPHQTIDTLLNLKAEMFRRMDLLEDQEVSNIINYNRKVKDGEKLPFILAVIDELFSFMTLPKSSRNEDEIYTQNVAYSTMGEIASMCRAVGIHLMFCTQKPTSDVIPTFITCNCGLRIGLKTSTEQESRNIIEDSGLELIDKEAKGSGIIKSGELTKFQSFYLTDQMVVNICKKHYNATKKEIKTAVLTEEIETKTNNIDWRNIMRGM